MAPQLGRNGWPERDVEQAITALKKGAYLLKYGKRGKPKFCPFSLSNDESVLIWISGKEEKHLRLSNVSRIISGQRTPIFQRHPRPEKEYQSFSLISNDGSLDVICKDKEEAEVWFSGLKALISRSHIRTRGSDTTIDDISSEATSPRSYTQHSTPLHPISDSAEILQKDCEDQFSLHTVPESPSNDSLDKAFLDVALAPQWFSGSGLTYGASLGGTVGFIGHRKAMREESLRVSLSSAVSSSNQGSVPDDGDSPGDVYMWGEGFWDDFKADYLVPQALKSAVVLDVQSVGCGGSYAALVTKQGEVFSWGVELGGRLGHGVASVTLQPKLIDSLKNTNVQLVACGEYHTCAVSVSGDLFTWGDGTHNYGLLGHGNKVSHWIPKRVRGALDGVHVSYVSCGPWHTAVVTSSGKLFTFGDGTFGVLGHGDRLSVHQPREVVSLKGLHTVRASCGVWHTAAVVDALTENTGSSDTSGKLFTWGDGDKGRLGHGDRDSKLVPTCVSSLVDANICQVACGHSLTVALSNSGQMYTMGTSVNGQLGNPEASAMRPTRVLGKLSEAFVEEIACGAYHVAARTSQNEVYTWGRGANGQLGHGDTNDRNSPALVEALKDKQVKSISCGTNFTAAVCNHKRISYSDQSICSDCSSPFNFKRKRHNCYHCGLIFCRACSDKKALNAAMAPNSKRPYHVCNSCYYNLSKSTESHASFGDSLGRKGSVPQGAVEPVQNGNKLDFPPHSVRSRFASMESFSLIDCTDFQRNKKVDLSDYHILPYSAANSQWGRFDISNTSNSMSGTSTKKNSASVPGSRVVSRAASPVSRDPRPRYFVTPNPTKKFSASVPVSRVVSRAGSPVSRDRSPRYFVTPNPIPDGSLPSITENGDDQTNASLSEEIMMLKDRVKELNHKVHLHDIELQKKAHDLKAAISVAAEETLKNQAAKEVIKSLASQLKEMAEKLPLARSSNFSVFPLDISITPLDGTQNRSVGLNTQRTYQESESDFSNNDPLYDRTSSKGFHTSDRSMVNNPTPTTRHANDCKGNESISGNVWSKEDDLGVYLTLTTVAGGHRQQLKRVRFSRKRFTDKQAEQWWAANHARVYEQYNIVAPGK